MTTNKETLLHAIEERKAKVCVLGLGYVGLPLAVRFTEAGYPVVGIDVDKEKIEKIQGIEKLRDY